MLLYYAGNWEKAMPIFEDASEWFRSKRMHPELWQAQRFLASCTTLAGIPNEDLFEENASRLESLANTLPGEERAIYLLNKWTADEELLKLQVDQLNSFEKESKSLPWYKRIRYKINILKQLSLILKSVDNRKIALASRKDNAKAASNNEIPPSWWRLLLLHPFRRATLSFLVLPNSTIIISRRWMWIDYVVSPTTRLDLRNQVRNLHESINRKSFNRRDILSRDLIPIETKPSPEESPSKKRERILTEITDAINLPELLSKMPRYVRKLTLVPDDVLHGVPFSAVKMDDEYLIQQYALSITYSSETPQNPRSRPVQKDLGALVVGVSQKNRWIQWASRGTFRIKCS